MNSGIFLQKSVVFNIQMCLCAAIGFAAMYYYATYKVPDTYTASATMYVYNGNPNIINYQ